MYKIKQKFTIVYEIDFEELDKEDFEELGFNSNKTIKDILKYNLQNVKEDIVKEYGYDNQQINFVTLKVDLEINNGEVTSKISEEVEVE